jgi:septal ring factor EnvC (AmiA/AmiB activator)
MLRQITVIALMLTPAAGLNAAQGETEVQSSNAASGANPIRKVVTMLQMMTNKIEAEQKKEKALYDKFMCYCETSDGELSKTIEDANVKIPQLESDIKEAIEEKARLETELEEHMGDRDAAKIAMEKATAIREKENAAFIKESTTDKSNIDALTKAITAISDGMAGGFLQTTAASVLKQLSVSTKIDMLDFDRQALVSFLSGGQGEGYAPKSSEILGIMKQLKDEMEKDLEEETAQEASAAQTYEELMAAKKKEVETLSAAIEEKLGRVGELGVNISMMKNDLEDTKESLGEDIKFLGDLKKTCATKTKEWEEREATRKQELIALAETIKILNDDDAMELFKKTLPSASLLQVEVTTDAVRARALQILKAAKSQKVSSQPIDFIELALHGKKMGFEKVITMIDEMVVVLKKEQVEDDHKKEYCDKEFDISDDKKKELELAISDSEKAIAETTDAIGTVTEEIAAVELEIKELDKSVVVATKQRKDEHAEYEETMASNTAAKELILFAKNRMQKFYNPKLYKPPPKRELSEEERITLNMGGTLAPTNPPGGIAGTGVSLVQVQMHTAQKKDAPAPPPEAKFGGKKSEEAGGVLQMMDLLVAEVDKEMTEAKVEEDDAQGDYEKLMGECSAKRATSSKTLTEKTAMKAEMETELQAAKDKKAADAEMLKATLEYIQSLHTECDFLVEYYTVRKEARASEIDALGKAKAVLSGADYSFLQTSASMKNLRGPQ